MEANRREALVAAALLPFGGLMASYVEKTPEIQPSVDEFDEIIGWMKSLPKKLVYKGREYTFEKEVYLSENNPRCAVYFRLDNLRPALLERETYKPYIPLEDVRVKIRIGVDVDGNITSSPIGIIPDQKIKSVCIEDLPLNMSIDDFLQWHGVEKVITT